jgi:hypothetical protein
MFPVPMPLPFGSGPTPRWVPVGGPYVAWARRRCLTAGVLVLVSDAVFLGVGLLVRDLPPTAQHLFHAGTVGAGVFSAAMSAFAAGLPVAGRRFLRDGHLDVAGAAMTRRLMTVFTVLSWIMLLIAGGIEAMNAATLAVSPVPEVLMYVALLGIPALLAAGVRIVVHGPLRPSAPAPFDV